MSSTTHNVYAVQWNDDATTTITVGGIIEPVGSGDKVQYISADAPIAIELLFDDALSVAKGCFDYSGGYGANKTELKIFHHGIQTVINALEGAKKTSLGDLQSKILHAIGSAAEAERV